MKTDYPQTLDEATSIVKTINMIVRDNPEGTIYLGFVQERAIRMLNGNNPRSTFEAETYLELPVVWVIKDYYCRVV